jgi:hypothetical protein
MTTILHPAAGAAQLRRIKRPKPAPAAPRMVGYCRVSTQEQHPEVQEAALRAAGCDVVFTERTSSRVPMAKRKDLQAALAAMRPGDMLV